MQIEIEADETIRPRGGESYAARNAVRLAALLNTIDLPGLLAVQTGAYRCPHVDSTQGSDYALRILAYARSEAAAAEVARVAALGTLGEWRAMLCRRYCGGASTPGERWIRLIASAIEGGA